MPGNPETSVEPGNPKNKLYRPICVVTHQFWPAYVQEYTCAVQNWRVPSIWTSLARFLSGRRDTIIQKSFEYGM